MYDILFYTFYIRKRNVHLALNICHKIAYDTFIGNIVVISRDYNL